MFQITEMKENNRFFLIVSFKWTGSKQPKYPKVLLFQNVSIESLMSHESIEL